MPFSWRKKKKETENVSAVQWEDNPLYNEREAEQTQQQGWSNPMNDYLHDMKNSKKTRHHQSLIRFFSKGDSKEYTNVKNALSDVEEYTSRNFVNDAELNSQIMNHAAKRIIFVTGVRLFMWTGRPT